MDRPTRSPRPARRAKRGRSGPRLRPATFADHEQIDRLRTSFGFASYDYQRWSHLWLTNPAYQRVRDRWNIGWVLASADDRVVGSVDNIPVAYEFEGNTLLAASSHTWVADPEYRSAALLLLDQLINQQGVDLFLTTTNSAASTPCVATLAQPVPLGDWRTVSFRVADYRRFARKALAVKGIPAGGLLAPPAAGALRTADLFAARPRTGAHRDVVTATVDDFDDRFDAFWRESCRQNQHRLMTVRDLPTLRWHYGELRRSGRFRLITATRRGLLRGYCVLRPHLHHSYEGMTGLRLLDYQSVDPEVDVLPALLDEALRCCRAEGLDVLEHLGHGIPKLRAFDEFARHRVRMAYNPFYYHVADPDLRARLAAPEVWDPSEYDGDTSLM